MKRMARIGAATLWRANFAGWVVIIALAAAITAGCADEKASQPQTATKTQALSTPSCDWVPPDFKGIDDGCDCPLDGNTSCDPDCANNGENSWCGCDYCFDGSGNEAESPPPGWEGSDGSVSGDGTGGGNSGASDTDGSGSGVDGGATGPGSCDWVPGDYISDDEGCDCPANGDTSCDPDCAMNGGSAWCGCDYCYDEGGNELTSPPDSSDGDGGAESSDLIDDIFDNSPDGTVGPAAPVGRLPTLGSVTTDGAYAHTIPIEVPLGRAGMQPVLALNYHSRGENGLVGVGWSLSGWSVITRCRKTYASGQQLPDRLQARQTENVQFDVSDEFCLDGQRLLLHSGTYGRAGSTYRTEIDTFARISLDTENALGPLRFTVRQKDGRIAMYEQPPESQRRDVLSANGGVIVQTQQVHLVWPLKTVSDRAGNVIEYRSTTFFGSLPVLDSIHYTQCASCGYQDAGRVVEFEYELRDDRRNRFVNGVGTRLHHRLKRITTYAPHPVTGASTVVSQYVLDYKLSAVSARSLLGSVTRCDGFQSDCHAAATGEAKVGVTTRFDWQGERAEDADFITLGGEFVEPCEGEICSFSPHAFPVLKFPTLSNYWPQGGDDNFAIADANGDGNDDIVIKLWPHFKPNGTWENDDKKHEERIMFGDGDGYFGPSRTLDLPQLLDFSDAIPPWNINDGRPPPWYPIEGQEPCMAGEIIDWGSAIPVDLDQDGKQELIAPENRLCPLREHRYRVYVQRGASGIYGNHAVLTLTPDRLSMRAIEAPEIDTLPWNGTKLLFADLDGDGLPDMLQGNVAYTAAEVATPAAQEASGAAEEVWRYRLARAVPGGLNVMYGTTTTTELPVWGAEPWIGRGNLLVDEDNDGRQELMQQSFGVHRSFALNRDLRAEYHLMDENTNQSLHALNLGDGDDEALALPMWWLSLGEDQPTPYAATATRGTTRFIDFNGDGLPDAMNLFVDQARNIGFEVRINTGAGYHPPQLVLQNGPGFSAPAPADLISREEREDMGIRIADFNGDGLEDMLYVGAFGRNDIAVGAVHIAYSDGQMFSSVQTLPAHELALRRVYRGLSAIQLAELDGNGMPDIVEMAYSPDWMPNALTTFGRRQIVTRSRHRLPGGTDVIIAVQDEYGEAEKITYDNLSHRTPRPGLDGRAGSYLEPSHVPDTLSSETQVSCRYPAKCVARGSVVRAYENKRTQRDVRETYKYYGARSDASGRGWLGFRKIGIQDLVTGRLRVQTFDQSYVGAADRTLLFHLYPNSGQPVSTFVDLTFAAAPAPDLDRWVTAAGVGNIAYGMSSSQTRTWTTTRPLRLTEVNSGTDVYLTHQYGTAGQSQERSRTLHDQYGNVWYSRHERSGVSGGNSIQELTTDFDIRESDWLISLPRKITRRSYNGLGLTCAGCNESISRTEFTYDQRGLLRSRRTGIDNGTPHLELSTQFNHDSAGLLTYVSRWDRQFETRVDFVDYDATGVYPRNLQNALGHVTRMVFDPRVDELAVVTDPNGVSTLFEYDGFGRRTLQRHASGSEVRFAYDAESRTAADLGGSVQKTFYDARGRPTMSATSTFDNGTVVQSRAYDSLGHVVRTAYAKSSNPMVPEHWDSERAEQLASIQLATLRYDAGGRIVSRTNGLNETATFSYPSIFTTRVVDPEGRISTYERDTRGSIIRLSQLESGTENTSSAVWAVTEYRYAPLGGLAAVYMPDPSVSGGLNRREFLYDEFGRVTSERGMDGILDKVVTYSAFGEVTRIVDRGMTSNFVYDDLSRVLERRESTTGDISLFEYDSGPNAVGSLVRATGIDGHVTDYRYDSVGRLSETIHSFADGGQERLSTGRSYDEFGRLHEIRYPEVDAGDEFEHPTGGGLAVRYQYRNGQLERVLDAQTGTPFWHVTTRHPLGMVTGAVNGDALQSTWTHEADTLRLQGYTADGPGGRVAGIGTDYDRSGRVITRTIGNTNEQFGYDALGRLKDYDRMVDGWIYHNASYTYEKTGNITGVRVGASLSDDWPFTSLSDERYSYDPAKRNLLSRIDGGSGNTSVSFGYDTAGRMLTRTTSNDEEDLRVVRYNSFDLPEAVESNQGTVTFFYDAFGKRVRKTRGADRATYVDNLYELHDFPSTVASGERVARSVFRIYGDNGPIALLTQDWNSGQELITYLHQDHQGSVTHTTRGFQAEQLGYFPFGRRMGSFPSPKPDFASDGYTGHSHDDDLGLINMGGRIFDPRTRRFLTPDPAVGMLFRTGGANLYSYVVNDPLNLTDPSGFHPEAGAQQGPGEIVMDPLVVNPAPSQPTTSPSGDPSYNVPSGPTSPTEIYGPSYNAVPTGPGDVNLGRGAGSSETGGVSFQAGPGMASLMRPQFHMPPGGYSYHQSRPVGAVADGVSKEMAMALLQADPNAFFPFGVHGIGSAAHSIGLQQNREYNLVGAMLGLPFKDPVEVTELTATSFAFTTLPGHFDGPGAIIRFSTIERDGIVYLEHDGYAPESGYLIGLFAPFFAGRAWDQQAAALTNALGGAWGNPTNTGIPGWGTWATPGGLPPTHGTGSAGARGF